MCATLSFSSFTGSQVALWVSPDVRPDESVEPLPEVKIQRVSWQSPDVRLAAASKQLPDLAAAVPAPADAWLAAPPATGNMGLAGVLPDNVGVLMSEVGAGEAGEGSLGSTTFFGARSSGNRFVFVIDNSSSMKDGRLEAAVEELLRCVEAMSRRQSFYVIFVSDRTYPMFYPHAASGLLPANAANRRRLAEWLRKLELAPGKNRELMTAMDLAASLRPEAVFLLWDADLRYSAQVRDDVMRHLTRPGQWGFPIHTLGMGTLSAESDQHLADIAAAHGGTYRRVPAVRTTARRPRRR